MFIQIGSIGFAVEDISAYDLEHKTEKGVGVRLMLKTRTEVLLPNGQIVFRRGLYDFYDENALKLRWFFQQALEQKQIIDLDKQWSDNQAKIEKLLVESEKSINNKIHEITLEDQLKASIKKLNIKKD